MKMILPTLAAALAAPAILFAAEPAVPAAADSEWRELSTALAPCVGVFTRTYDTFMATTSLCAPFVGNGNFRAALAGNRVEQDLLFENSEMWTDRHGPKWADTIRPVPFGGLRIKATTPAPINNEEYRLEHNLPQASMSGRSAAGFATRSWMAAGENVLVTEISNARPQSLILEVTLWGKADNPFLPAASGLENGSLMWATRETFGGKRDVPTAQDQPDWSGGRAHGSPYIARWTTRVAVAARIFGATATFKTNAKGDSTARFTLIPGEKVVVATVMKGGKNTTTHRQEAVAAAGALTPSVLTTLESAHVAWWKNFWLKSYLLTGDPVLDKYYYGGLYLNACINRAPFTPAGQYPFCPQDFAAWAGDYHLNQEYFGQNCWSFAANRAEWFNNCLQPMLDLVPSGRENAARMRVPVGHRLDLLPPGSPASRRGIFFTVGCGPWGLSTENFTGCQVTDASFTGATLVYWYYAYTQNREWLRTTGYPFLRELGDFWESHLTLENGRYCSRGATHETGSPELNPAADIGFAKFIMRALLTCSRDLDVDADRRAKWQDILARISDYPTMKHNGKTVFAQSVDNAATKNFCGCRACGAFIYPAEDLNRASPKAQLTVALDTIASAGPASYEFPVLAIQGSRVGYPAEKLIANIKQGLLEADTGTWTGGRPNFTFGAFHYNGAYLEFLHSAMLQNEDGDGLRLFPGWPQERPAKFVRLRAKGAFLVSAELKDGVVRGVRILSEKVRDLTVVNPWPSKQVRVTRNSKEAEKLSGERFTLKTSVGEALEFKPE